MQIPRAIQESSCFSLSQFFSPAALHHLINGDNFQQSSVTCKLGQVVGSEMKIDP